VLILKIIFKKIYIYYFDVFLSKIHFEKKLIQYFQKFPKKNNKKKTIYRTHRDKKERNERV
jgi:hypothetical protein